MNRRIPYAVANYEEIVRDGYHFVDKTRFIRELEHYEVPVFLRPRRFGKSLWCSILECYYDVNRKDRFDELFAGTDIGRAPTPLRNSQLVMRFDFSKVRRSIPCQGSGNVVQRRVVVNVFDVFLARLRRSAAPISRRPAIDGRGRRCCREFSAQSADPARRRSTSSWTSTTTSPTSC